MRKNSTPLAVLLVAVLMTVAAGASQAPSTVLRPGAKVFVAEMPDGFDTYLKAAFGKKKVPLVVVPTKAEAEFEIKGSSETQKAGAAKKIFMGSWHSDEQASISVTNLASAKLFSRTRPIRRILLTESKRLPKRVQTPEGARGQEK